MKLNMLKYELLYPFAIAYFLDSDNFKQPLLVGGVWKKERKDNKKEGDPS